MNPWYERSGGYIVACCIHLVIFSYMMMKVAEAAVVAPEPPPLELNFIMPEEAGGGGTALPDAAAAAADSTPPTESPGAAAGGDDAPEMTSPPPTEEEPEEKPETRQEESKPEVALEPAATPQAKEMASPTPAPEAKPEPTPMPEEKISDEGVKFAPKKAEAVDPAELTRLAEIKKKEKREKAWEEWNRKYGSPSPVRREGRTLKDALLADEVKTMGKKHLEPTKGAGEGAVRRFDMRGDQRIIDEVMGRYSMRIVTRFVSGREGNSAYLSQAKTNKGTYYNDGSPGWAEVFEIGAAGSNKMKILEAEELRAKGFDPTKSRVIEIVFGIVHVGPDQYDLGVLSSKFESLEATPVPTATNPPIYFGKP